MHNHVADRWFQALLKKQLSYAFRIYLSIAVILSPIFLINNANAASIGGWTLGTGVASGASMIYNGTKEVVLNGAKKSCNWCCYYNAHCCASFQIFGWGCCYCCS